MVKVLTKELKKASSALRQDFLKEVALKVILRDTDCVCVCVCVRACACTCMHAHVHTDALGFSGNAERIGDHAMNIGEYTDIIYDKSINFSNPARDEIKEMKDITCKTIHKIMHPETSIDTANWLSEIAAFEQQMDDMTDRKRHRSYPS